MRVSQKYFFLNRWFLAQKKEGKMAVFIENRYGNLFILNKLRRVRKCQCRQAISH